MLNKNIEGRKRGRPKKTETKTGHKNKEKIKETQLETKLKDGITTRSKSKKIIDTSFPRYTKGPETTENYEDVLGHVLLAAIHKDPSTYEEAINSEEKVMWLIAIQDELNSMKENAVWELIDRPKIKENGKRPNIIDSRWIFKKKIKSDGTITYKARLVIRGFKDKNDYGIKETYAPVSRMPLIRAILSIINKENLEMCQMDVKTAFLNGELNEEVYMEIPEGLKVSDSTKLTKVCKLKRALYGLKTSPKKWYKRFSEEAHKLGLENDLHDPCLYTWRKEGKLALIILYVDDMLIASNDHERLIQIKEHLSSVFEMKDLGEPKNFLGMSIQRNRSEKYIVLHQSAYIEGVLERFKMRECKPQSTPMVTRQANHKNKKRKIDTENSEHQGEAKRFPFREAIGSLMYLANATSPDISYAVNYLARNQTDPTEEDWNDVKRILRYLRGTCNLGIKFQSKSETLDALTDASFRDCEKSAFTAGYVIRLYGDVIA